MGKILQELPPVGVKYITQLLNASLLLGYFPNQWKVAQIILLLKPGKPPNVPPKSSRNFSTTDFFP
jgi:hypothetical protein